ELPVQLAVRVAGGPDEHVAAGRVEEERVLVRLDRPRLLVRELRTGDAVHGNGPPGRLERGEVERLTPRGGAADGGEHRLVLRQPDVAVPGRRQHRPGRLVRR